MISTAEIKAQIHARVLTAEGISESIIASEGHIFTPPADNAFHVRETFSEFRQSYPAQGLRRIDGYVTYELFTPSGSGMETADGTVDRIASVFDPFLGEFGSARCRIQPFALRHLNVSEESGRLCSGLRIQFFSYESLPVS